MSFWCLRIFSLESSEGTDCMSVARRVGLEADLSLYSGKILSIALDYSTHYAGLLRLVRMMSDPYSLSDLPEIDVLTLDVRPC